MFIRMSRKAFHAKAASLSVLDYQLRENLSAVF